MQVIDEQGCVNLISKLWVKLGLCRMIDFTHSSDIFLFSLFLKKISTQPFPTMKGTRGGL